MRAVISRSVRRAGMAWQRRFDWPRPARNRYSYSDPPSTYVVMRHASIAGAPGPSDGLAWVVIARWQFDNGTVEWFTEYWDDRFNEESPEEQHRSEGDAVAHAERLFGQLDWQRGSPPR